jgi:hypothetical protein
MLGNIKYKNLFQNCLKYVCFCPNPYVFVSRTLTKQKLMEQPTNSHAMISFIYLVAFLLKVNCIINRARAEE